MKRPLAFYTALCGVIILATSAAWSQQAKPIESVQVVGNSYIPKEGILDEVKNILKVGEPYTPERAQQAHDAIMAMGYFDDVSITSAATAKGVAVTITVVEKQRVKQILFVGNTVFTDKQLSDVIITHPGNVVDDRIIRGDVRRIENYYAQKGYVAHVSKASVGQYGVLTFVIEEDRIEDIVIQGLKRTHPVVVRRELTIQRGELFQEKQLAKDIQKIFNLGIFKNVTSDIRPGIKDPERGIIVVINVEEKRTGQASVAAGYSSLDRFVLVLSLAENNFRGMGERAAINTELFGRTSYEVSFFEPYVDKKGTSLSTRIYDTEQQRRFIAGTTISTATDQFEERRSGATVAISTPINDSSRFSIRLRSERVSSAYFEAIREGSPSQISAQAKKGVTTQQTPGYYYIPGYGQAQPTPDNPSLYPDYPEPGNAPGPVIVAAPLFPGGRLVSVSLGWTRDTRNIIANPSSGTFTSANLEQAGDFLGGNTTFTKFQFEQRFYHKLDPHRDVLAMRLMAGWGWGSLPLFESYSVGGANTLRGYQEDRFRGENMLLANVEYRHPITTKLTGVGFIDVGDAYGGSFPTIIPGFNIPAEDQNFTAHVGVGAGIRVITPIGPIRLDFGWGSEGSQAHFAFGHTF